MSIARYELCSYFGSMYEISSSMKTFFGSMYEISSYYDRDFLIHEIFISWRFHDPYIEEAPFKLWRVNNACLCLSKKLLFPRLGIAHRYVIFLCSLDVEMMITKLGN